MGEPLEDKVYGQQDSRVHILCCHHLQWTLFKELIPVLRIENIKNTT